METTLPKQSAFKLSGKTREIIADLITYLFIALFIYTATDKFFGFANFEKFIIKLDLMRAIGKYVAFLIPASEVAISLVLLFPKTRKLGLYYSLGLMILFTAYLVYMKLTAETLPCHCGGVISRLSWTQHIGFNILLIGLAIAGIAAFRPAKK